MESYKCLAPPLEPLDQVERIEYGANNELSFVLFELPTKETASKSVETNLFSGRKKIPT